MGGCIFNGGWGLNLISHRQLILLSKQFIFQPSGHISDDTKHQISRRSSSLCCSYPEHGVFNQSITFRSQNGALIDRLLDVRSSRVISLVFLLPRDGVRFGEYLIINITDGWPSIVTSPQSGHDHVRDSHTKTWTVGIVIRESDEQWHSVMISAYCYELSMITGI